MIRAGCVMLAWGILCTGSVRSAEQPPLFPFIVSYDAPDNATNVSAWIERPAGARGFVRAEGERLVTSTGPIRLWAVNLCFDACFPEHDLAERVAARLARLGVNCVRMHHMDSRCIWGSSPNKRTIDPEKFERLDYLIYQLKQHGIYTNLNLHVSRTLGPKEGFPNVEGRPKYDKGVGNFDPRMIEAQKEYARDLLTHVNPYTHTAYTDEPAVALVEISNEDALFSIWSRRQLDDLPEPYATTFRKLWNAWLRKKYGSTKNLKAVWNVGSRPLGAEMLTNGDFRQPLGTAWHLERDAQTVAEWSVADGGPNGQPRLRLVVTRLGEVAWHPQLLQSGLAVKDDTLYTMEFSIRSDGKRSVSAKCTMAHDPWHQLGLTRRVEAGPEWQRLRIPFVASRDDDKTRIGFSGFEPGTYELAGVSLKPGGIVGLEPGRRIEDDGVPIIPRGAMAATKAARRDFVDFLCDTEHDYWLGMYAYLKEDLGVKSLVSGTQAGYGPLTVQAELDYVDVHSYWKHPRFPGRPWDPRNWTVDNVAMVNNPPGTLGPLAGRRILGMAYTVSEYNHPSPNFYAAEGFPMVAAFGAFQAWSGIFPFAYCHSRDCEPRRMASYFDIKADTHKLVHMPACAAMFLRGDVQPAQEVVAAQMSPATERAALTEHLTPRCLDALKFSVDWQTALEHRVGLELVESSALPAPVDDPTDSDAAADDEPQEDAATSFVSDTGQVRWDVSQKDAGTFTVDAPRTKLFTGFVRGRRFDFGGVKLAIGPTRLDWATVSMTCLDGQGFDRPGRVLVAATGWVQNTGAEVQDCGNNRITLGNQWGSEPVLCEGIPAEIQLPVDPARVTFYPLDESGNRGEPVKVGEKDRKTRITLDPKHRTVWYEVEIR